MYPPSRKHFWQLTCRFKAGHSPPFFGSIACMQIPSPVSWTNSSSSFSTRIKWIPTANICQTGQALSSNCTMWIIFSGCFVYLTDWLNSQTEYHFCTNFRQFCNSPPNSSIIARSLEFSGMYFLNRFNSLYNQLCFQFPTKWMLWWKVNWPSLRMDARLTTRQCVLELFRTVEYVCSGLSIQSILERTLVQWKPTHK